MEKSFENRLKQLLILLSADAETQTKAFPSFVLVPDELAAEVADAVELSSEELDGVAKEFLGAIQKIDAIFEQMSENEEYWTLESLSSEAQWNIIRDIARQELRCRKILEGKPDLFWLTYIDSTPPTTS